MGNSYAGIDYGRGMSNVDHETGIRYGVISMHEVSQAWADSSEAQYGRPTEAIKCPCCNETQFPSESVEWGDSVQCETCGSMVEFELEDMLEPDCFTYSADGYQCQQGGDDSDIFILKSPYFTYCQFCSPCAPGAGYLMNYFKISPDMPIDDSLPLGGYAAHAIASGFPMAYCLGHDFFDDNRAPYPVFSVETGELVNP